MKKNFKQISNQETNQTCNERKEDQPMWKWILLGAFVLATVGIIIMKKTSSLSIKGPVTFDDYLKSVETCCDNYFIKLKKKRGNAVKGAKCELSHKSGCIQSVIKVYEYVKSEWIVHAKTFSTPFSKFSMDAVTQAKLADIKEKPMLFDVEMPK